MKLGTRGCFRNVRIDFILKFMKLLKHQKSKKKDSSNECNLSWTCKDLKHKSGNDYKKKNKQWMSYRKQQEDLKY